MVQKRLWRLPKVHNVVVNADGQTQLLAEQEFSPEAIRQALAGTPYQLS